MEPEILPQGAQSLDAIIEQSKSTIAEAQAPKRGRGRPKGTFKKPQNSSENPTVETSSPDGNFKAVHGEVLPAADVEPMAQELVKLPFDFAGMRFDMDLTPDEIESKASTFYLSRLINSYLPDLSSKDPKTFNLVAFLITYTLLGIKKFRKFTEKKKNKIQKENQNNEPVAGKESVTDSGTPQTVQTRPLPTESVPASAAFSGGIR